MSAQKPSLLGTLGADAAAKWLAALSLEPTPRWYAEIELANGESRFQLNIYAEEWGFAFHHGDQASWIRVTDIPFVHGRDDYSLLAHTPDLLDIGGFITSLEKTHGLAFARHDAVVRTNLDGAKDVIRAWLEHPGQPPRLRRTREL
jgi:hypothetical protein